MLSEKMTEALNKQLNAELYSAYLYQAMSAYADTLSLEGFASWLAIQAQEEMFHAKKFYDFILQRGGEVLMARIDAPPAKWDSPEAIFADTLAHERKVTAMINDLVDLAEQEKDKAGQAFLQWFITEQVEEEDTADRILQQIRLMGDAKGGLFMLDRELAKRAPLFSFPAGEAE